jgi:hypothetical protein
MFNEADGFGHGPMIAPIRADVKPQQSRTAPSAATACAKSASNQPTHRLGRWTTLSTCPCERFARGWHRSLPSTDSLRELPCDPSESVAVPQRPHINTYPLTERGANCRMWRFAGDLERSNKPRRPRLWCGFHGRAATRQRGAFLEASSDEPNSFTAKPRIARVLL